VAPFFRFEVQFLSKFKLLYKSLLDLSDTTNNKTVAKSQGFA